MAPTQKDSPGFANAGMGDEEGVEIWEQRPRGHQPNLLLHRSGEGQDRGPLPKDRWGVEISGLVDEGFDPRFQLPFAAFWRRGRGIL